MTRVADAFRAQGQEYALMNLFAGSLRDGHKHEARWSVIALMARRRADAFSIAADAKHRYHS